MLVLSRRVGEELMIGDDVVVIVNEIRDNQVKLCIEAPLDIAIDREEIRKSKDKERNK